MQNNIVLYSELPRTDFQESFVRMFPETVSDKGMVTRNITFVTTERCNLNCSYCVTGDTEIVLSNYTTKKIKDIKIGERVLAFDEFPGFISGIRRLKTAVVEQTFERKSEIIEIELSDKTVLQVTKNHPLLTIREHGTSYVDAGELSKGETIFRINNELYPLKRDIITDIRSVEGEFDVYNIGTTSRTYFANSIAVHNCYESHKTSRNMSIETARKGIDAIFDAEMMNGYIDHDVHKCAIIEFIGGEPFMNIDVIDFICEYFVYKATILNHPWKNFHMFSTTTNGVLNRTEKVQNWIKKYGRRASVSITIDGDKELHDACRVFHDGSGSHDIVLESVKDAIENFGLYQTKVTIAPENLTKINTAIPYLFDLGIHEIHANCVYENVWTDEHPPVFYKELVKLADYIIDNELYLENSCSLFDFNIGRPIDPEENKNWCGGDQNFGLLM